MKTVMDGKVCVITGATSGIGLATAEALAAKGARIVMVGRDQARAKVAVARVSKHSSGARTTVHYADLSEIAQMKRVASELAAAEPRIDVLINCAGAAFSPRAVTADGIEKTFALNHLAYFMLCNLLAANVRAAGAGRIVNVASNAHRRARLDFDDLMFERGYRPHVAYARSKLANVLFTRELARRLAGTGVTANAVHPGFVNTRIGDNIGGIPSAAFRLWKTASGRTVEEGAETPVHVASSPDVANVSGEYFSDCKVERTSPEGEDDDAARRLWDASVKLTGVGG